MTHKKLTRPSPGPSPPSAEDRGWAARAEGLNREIPAAMAIVGAILAALAMLIGWVVIVIQPSGNMRGNPIYLVLAAPLMPWIRGLATLKPWAVNTVWLALLLAPCLSMLAVFVAPFQRDSALLSDSVPHLDTPLAMLVILGITTTLSAAGLLALRRSSLPGGTRPITYVAPGTPRPGRAPLRPAATIALMKGSLPLSGALINGIFFAIVAMIEPLGPFGGVWPVAVVAILVLSVGTLVFRGGFRLKRRRPGAARDLSRGWRLGMGCAVAAVPALWALPVSLSGKLGLSCFMVPLAVAAAWCGTSALKALPGIVGDGGRDRGLTP